MRYHPIFRSTCPGLLAILILGLPGVLHAQPGGYSPGQQPVPNAATDASRMPEAGPAIVGGSGATAGPNARNQAITPMPGSRQMEELSEQPGDAARPRPGRIPLPDATPPSSSR
ncbi:MAG: hypothetical protein ACOY4R_00985 [Pseudomonadota bacterium]